MNEKPEPKKGIKRIFAAFFYSMDGLWHSLLKEAAFRQEAMLLILATILLYFLPFSILWKIILWWTVANVLIVELLNTGIEKIVDLCSPNYHILAKQAKDIGSAAVFISLFIAFVVWSFAFYNHFG